MILRNIKAVKERHAEYLDTRINMAIHDHDKMLSDRSVVDIDHYFAVGRDAVEVTVETMIVSRRSRFDSILEFPSGHGRVTRHLTAFFPDANITVSDLFPGMMDFCVESFGVTASLSKEDFTELDFGREFDLIWCGSLLTHLDEAAFTDCFDCIVRHLSESNRNVCCNKEKLGGGG